MRDVTLLLTDVEGSTALWEHRPDDMWRALEAHDELFARLVPAHGGRLIKPRGEGDSMFCVFPGDHAGAAGALRCALHLQQALHDDGTWPHGTQPLSVRIALHTGPAHLRDDDYYGPTVNRAARLRGTVHGGQVVVSQATRDLIAATQPLAATQPHAASEPHDDAEPPAATEPHDDVTLQDLGEHRLKDLLRPERAFQLCHPSIPSRFPPLRSLDPRRHNLPVVHTPLVGRETELPALSKLLSSRRVVTLLGGPGVGKTRLALQLAAEAADAPDGPFPDGAFLVELQGVTDPDLLEGAAAAQLGLQARQDATAAIASWAGTRRLLLVLDNAEHLPGAAARLVARLVEACPQLVVLSTSRERLGLPGEQVVVVAPLDVPAPDDPLEAAASCASVRLFYDRAASAGADPDALPLPSVASVCAAVDGIPLAVELAAARVRHLPMDAIVAGLSSVGSDVLSGAIEWTWRMLSRAERTLLSRLSVFRGGAVPDAIVAVAGEDLAGEVHGLLSRVVDRSLLDLTAAGRYRMLEPVREFCASRLGDAEAPAVRDAHARWFAAFAARTAPELDGAGDVSAVAALDAELDNLRAALVAAPAPVARPLGTFWLRRGLWREGRDWLDLALKETPDDPALHLARGRLANRLGDRPDAEADLRLALQLARERGDRRVEARTLHGLATVAFDREEFSEAERLTRESMEAAEDGDESHMAQALNLLGNVALRRGELEEAERLYEECLGVRGDAESAEMIGSIHANIGHISLLRGDLDGAKQSYESALRRLSSSSQVAFAARILASLGNAHARSGDFAAARLALMESRTIAVRVGDTSLVEVVDGLLAEIRHQGATA